MICEFEFIEIRGQKCTMVIKVTWCLFTYGKLVSDDRQQPYEKQA